jgi:hypothetical protein
MRPGAHGRRPLALAIALVLLSTLPFAGRAFHIDEPAFIAVARNILADPLRPFAGAAALDDRDRQVFAKLGRPANTFESMSHPPLVPYALAVAAWPAGRFSERLTHLLFAAFPLLAALSVHSLAGRFTRSPLLATLFVLSSPIFVSSAQAAMTDMPMFGLGLGALALFVSGIDGGRRGRLLLSGALAGLAVLARYEALGLLPLGLAYAVSTRGRLASAAWALPGFALLLCVWVGQNLAVHGEVHVLASARHYARYYQLAGFGPESALVKAVSDLSAIGGTGFAAYLLVVFGDRAVWRRIVHRACLLLCGLLCLGNPLDWPPLRGYTEYQALWLTLCLSAGIVLVVEAIVSALAPAAGPGPPAADRVFMVCWLAGALATGILVLPFGAARYMLPVLPPLAMILVASREGRIAHRPWLRPAGAVAIALTFAGALLLSAVDHEHAGAYRAFAATHPAPSLERGRTWFVGDWGFRHYMEQAGHTYLLSSDNAPAVGDLIVQARTAGNHSMSKELLERVARVRSIEVPGRIPIRLLNGEARAGFYSHAWGLPPFARSHDPLERFDVYRVQRSAARP